ncbi:MAG TPA: glucose-6-phosphate isomerase [Chlamydiales bacterium]|nr:glucose-6-phosphate isomerase [Chlamydiales bacterium]HPE84558.1 glucose-6-phosphate isomerase [Chlamydiales bacterium]
MYDLPAAKKLSELAQNPINLNEKKSLTCKRIEEMVCSSLGLKLLFATERVNDEVMQGLFELAKERNVIEQMEAMQSGEIINRIEGHESENRSVLHTAMRDFFENQRTEAKAHDAAAAAFQELEKLKRFLEGVNNQGVFTDIIQVGIGGSELGPKAIYLALEAFKKEGRTVHFLSNVDPDDATAILRKVDLAKTLVVVVSKSGTTLETRTNEEFIRQKLLEKGLSPKEHMIAVTGENSPMDDPSKYRASFYMWDYVGGRYSASSMVGGVAIAFALGMDKFLDFLRGMSAMDKAALNPDFSQNLPLVGALLSIWNRNFLKHHTKAIIPYSRALSRFSAHLQQLSMESNGKQIDRLGQFIDFETGPIIWGEPGTNGQHSFYQLIHQGMTVVPIEFIGFKQSQFGQDIEVEASNSQEKLVSNLIAQAIGLATGKEDENPNKVFKGNRPTRILAAKKCDAYTMGLILSYYEHVTAFEGFIWNINSFDQEGVQLGKVLANKVISIYASRHKKEEGDPRSFPEASSYINHFDSL